MIRAFAIAIALLALAPGAWNVPASQGAQSIVRLDSARDVSVGEFTLSGSGVEALVRVEGTGREKIHFSNPTPPPGVSKLCSLAEGIPPGSVDAGKQP